MLNSQSSHPLPQNLWWNRTRGCSVYGPYAVFGVTVAGSLPIRKSTCQFGGGIFTSPIIRNCLSVCLCIRAACDTIRGGGGTDLPQTQTESDSARDELRESRDSANDCQSRELRSRTTHAGVITICTVPEMLPETWTRGHETNHTDDEN